jgi:hypothetical protein
MTAEGISLIWVSDCSFERSNGHHEAYEAAQATHLKAGAFLG